MDVLESDVVAAEGLESAGTPEEGAGEARLRLEGERALGGDGLVVHGAHLHEAGRAIAVEDGAVRVAAGGELEGHLVLPEGARIILGLE